MNALASIISTCSFPTAHDLLQFYSTNSAFQKRTRHLANRDGTFISAPHSFEGATWSFTSVDKSFPTIQQSCYEIERFTRARVQCNAYLTPPHGQGLPPHYDLHDVFIVQTEGSKVWQIWPSFRKNISLENMLLDEQNNLSIWTNQVTPLVQELHTKDCLYLRKGEPHAARASSSKSLHFSFGIYYEQ